MTRLPYLDDGEAFIANLERAIEAGDAEHVEQNMPRLECLIGLLQQRTHELARLQYRARLVRDRHEPPAERRCHV